jgi:transcriptional regulator with XRE-family HTH domain
VDGALTAMVQQHRDRSGMSVAEMAERAGVNRNVLWKILGRRSARTLPRPETLDKLAAMMRLNPEVLHAAAMEQAGYRVPSGLTEFDAEWMMAGRGLSEEQRRSVIQAVTDLLDEAPRRRGRRVQESTGVFR